MQDHAKVRSNSTEDARSTARRPVTAPPAPASGLLGLQATVGNAAVVQRVQQQHRHGAGCGHGAEEAPVHRSAVHDVLRAGGRPLDGSTRADMESRLGADFSDVRIHDNSAAKASAAQVGARAYTSGNHVVIGEGGADKLTLAHELTHVIQQRQGPVAGTDNGAGLRVSDPSDRFEREAESNARRAMSGAAPRTEQHAREGRADQGAAQAPVQRWAAQAGPNQQGMTVSANGVFAVPNGDATSIWVRVNAPAGSYSPALRPTSTAQQALFGGTEMYQEHELARNILDDCLHTAEEIMHNAVGELADGANSNVRTSAGLKAFGMSDEQNRERAGDFQGATDRNASPTVGQSYLMLAMNPGEEIMSQYHAAAVVGMDGQDTVTMEAFAGSGQTVANPMAYTIGTVSSFHDYWTGEYYTPHYPAVTMKTVVLVKRGRGRRVAAGSEQQANPNVA
ncbi:eCIS core domain-containing protein [Streptomyces sp. NPDC004290]